MLRVGLTGDLGSGKSTVAAMLADYGALVLSSDEMGSDMMQPGKPVSDAIVAHFGAGVVQSDGALNRKELSRLAFTERRVEELNAIVHPAVLEQQAKIIAEIAETKPDAIVVVESALIFSTKHAGKWTDRFDEVIVVAAPENAKIARFVERVSAGRTQNAAERTALETEARKRLDAQRPGQPPDEDCIIVRNNGDRAALASRVTEVWRALERMASRNRAVAV